MIRFIHSADWQLGMTRRYLSDEAQQRFTQDRINAIRRIGEHAGATGAQFVIVAGDVFESNQVERQTVVRALDAMDGLPAPVFRLPGNHDPLDASSVYRSQIFEQRRPRHVHVLTDTRPVRLDGLPGVELVGAPWRSKRPLEDPLSAALDGLEPPDNALRVVVGHGIVDVLSPDPDNPALIRLALAERALGEGRAHYIGLGDRHSATELGTTGAIWYAGAPVATAFDEQAPGFALDVKLEAGRRPEVARLEIGGWTFEDHVSNLRAEADVELLEQWLGERPEKECTALYLTLEGTISVAAKARLDEVLDGYADNFASLRVHERTSDLHVLPDEADARSLELSGYARAAWDRLAAVAAAGGEDAEEAVDALSLLYRLSRGGER